MTVSHRRQNYSRLVLQIYVGPIPFLQNPFVEIVAVMDVQVPAPDFRNGHVVAAQFGRLHVPNDVLAVFVLVANLHHRRGHAVDALAVNVESVPGVGEFDDGVRLERLLKENALDGDAQVDEIQGRGNDFRGELKLDRGQIAGGARAVVNEVQAGAGDLEALLDDLGLGENGAFVGARALEAVLPGREDDGFHEVVVVGGARVRDVDEGFFVAAAHDDVLDDDHLWLLLGSVFGGVFWKCELSWFILMPSVVVWNYEFDGSRGNLTFRNKNFIVTINLKSIKGSQGENFYYQVSK